MLGFNDRGWGRWEEGDKADQKLPSWLCLLFISVLRHQIQKRDSIEILVQKLKLCSSYKMTTWDGSAEYPILSFSSALGVNEDKKKYTNNKRCYEIQLNTGPLCSFNFL